MAGLTTLVSVAKAEIEKVAPQPTATSGCPWPSWIDPLVPYTDITNTRYLALYLFTAFSIKPFTVGHNGSIKLYPALHRIS
jgi:hypothetical protein